MSKKIITIFLVSVIIALIVGCAGIPVRVASRARANIRKLNEVRIGMSKSDVLNLMGTPSKSEASEAEGIVVEVLFYLTEFAWHQYSGVQRLDYTPLVFEGGILKRWGKNYYEQRLRSPRAPKDQT